RIDGTFGVRQLSRPAAIGARPARSWLYPRRERQDRRRQLRQSVCRNADLAVSGQVGSDTTYPVIASEAKQSRARRGSSARDCFVAQRAPRNDSRLSSQRTTHIAPTSSEI